MKEEVGRLRGEHQPVLQLERKLSKLEGRLRAVLGVDAVSSNPLARQGRRIEALEADNRRLRREVSDMCQENGALRVQLEQEQGRAKELQRLLFGARSERRQSSGSKSDVVAGSSAGQSVSRGGKSGRRDRSHLPVVEEVDEVCESQRVCTQCHLPYRLQGHEDSELIEVEVKAHCRRIRRQRWRSQCECAGSVEEVVAAPVARFFPAPVTASVFGLGICIVVMGSSKVSVRWFV